MTFRLISFLKTFPGKRYLDPPTDIVFKDFSPKTILWSFRKYRKLGLSSENDTLSFGGYRKRRIKPDFDTFASAGIQHSGSDTRAAPPPTKSAAPPRETAPFKYQLKNTRVRELTLPLRSLRGYAACRRRDLLRRIHSSRGAGAERLPGKLRRAR